MQLRRFSPAHPKPDDRLRVKLPAGKEETSFGPVRSLPLNMIDDAIFTMLDISNGMDPLDAMESFGKKAVTSYVSGKIGQAFNGVSIKGADPTGGLLQTLDLTDNVIGSTLLKGTELMASNIASSAVNSISVRGLMSGGDFFNEKAFMEGSFGNSALAGVAAGMAGHGVTGGLNSMISDSSLAGFARKYSGGVRNLTGTIGNLASTGVTYGLTGNATVNLINTSMFGLTDKNGGAVSVGLFEFGFGKDGMQSRIGMGGTDLNLGKIMSSIHGVNALHQNSRINEYVDKNEGLEANVALRALFSYGDKTGSDTYGDILNGRTKLAVNENLEGDATAKTVLNEDSTKTIILRSLSNDVATGVMAGIVLQHEAYRDGIESADQQGETHAAVKGHTEMALRVAADGVYTNVILNNSNLVNDIGNYMKGEAAFREYSNTAYSSEKDYWKVTKEGNLIWDGRKDLFDENDRLLKETDDQTFYGSFASAMGISKSDAEKILTSDYYNIAYRNNKVISLGDDKDRTNDESFQFETSSQFKAKYDIQMNLVDKVWDNYSGNMVQAVNDMKQSTVSEIVSAVSRGENAEVAIAKYQMLGTMDQLASKWNETMFGTQQGGKQTIPGLYNPAVAAAFDEKAISSAINDVANNRKRTDSHPLYKYLMDGTFSPLLGADGTAGIKTGANKATGEETYITTRVYYNDGTKHGWERDSTFAMSVDIGTRNKPLIATTISESSVLAQNFSVGWNDRSGGYAQVNAGPLDFRYVHLAQSQELQRTIDLNQYVIASSLFRYDLPAGYNFGPLYDGKLPLSTGTHLHWEAIYR